MLARPLSASVGRLLVQFLVVVLLMPFAPSNAAAAAAPTLCVKDASVTERDGGQGAARVVVSLSRRAAGTVQVRYATVDGTARAPADYRKTVGRLTFRRGVVRKVISIPVKGDLVYEPTERFRVRLQQPHGARIADGSATVTIRDNDPQPPTTDEPESESTATVSLTDASATGFNAAGEPFGLAVSTPGLEPATAALLVDGQPSDDGSWTATAAGVTLPEGLPEGRHRVALSATDGTGDSLQAEFDLWFGELPLVVTVQDATGAPVADAAVEVSLSDNPEVRATGTSDAQGQLELSSLPDRSFAVTAHTADNRLGTAAVTGTAGEVTLVVQGMNPSSPVANNDFSLGVDGWATGTAPVSLVEHVEGPLPPPAPFAAPKARRTTAGSTDPFGRARPARRAADFDLEIATAGEGPQSVSRTFDVGEGTRTVTVRYRFVTSEVPGGWFGSQYNDNFSVSIRSRYAGDMVQASNSMNGLGLAAFDGGGATAWVETQMAVSEDGDSVQFDLTVANVSDDLLDSYLVVDLVKEKRLAITAHSLNDIDNTSLDYLSASSHAYFGGMTRVHGTLRIEGDSEDELEGVTLEVREHGVVIATAELTQGLRGTVYRQFGESETIEVPNVQRLFDIPSGSLAAADQQTNGTLQLKIEARSANDTAEADAGQVTKLVRYTGANRYGGRDEAAGGDDWVKPSVRAVLADTAGATWGDMSNMNGGRFVGHNGHRTGNSADGWFAGYNARNAATAQAIIGHLNHHGTRISTVYVTFTPAFQQAIQGVVLNDGRRATDVIRNAADHDTHFHWEVTD
jgi:hypothetical protein